MSLATESYTDLKNLAEATFGKPFGSHEETRFKSLVNLAARRIYNASVWWERFLVVSEPRSVSRGDIAFTEDSFYVYGAGTADVNGLYLRNDSENGLPVYTKYSSDGTTPLYNIWNDGVQWLLTSTGIGVITGINILYAIPLGPLASNPTPPSDGWGRDSSYDSENPSPMMVDLAEMDTILQVNRYDLVNHGSYCPLGYHVTSRGVTLHNADEDIVYVTYRKPLSDTYGDGTAGTTSDIPQEWFNYISLYAGHEMGRIQRQANGNEYFPISAREVQEALTDALMKQEEQNISNSIARRIKTHLQYNTQL